MEIYLGLVWAAIFTVLFSYRIVLWTLRYVRQLASLGHDKQRIFAYTDSTYAFFKRHILYAPLFRRRHHREFKLSAAINVGTLPSRPQTFFLIGYVGMNVALSVVHLPWTAERHEIASYLRNRTGVLAVMNMIPLFLFAGRNNPLIWMLDISFDSYNLMHRWVGRTVVLQALAHILAWMVDTLLSSSWHSVSTMLINSPFFLSGSIGSFALLFMLLQSPSIIRHAFYEVFLGLHFLLAATAVVTIWIHLKGMPQQHFLKAAIILWAIERVIRVYKLIRNNVAHSRTTAEVTLLPGDAVRVTLHIARPWTFKPGQHVFLYMPRIGMWTSHPFSLAWSDEGNLIDEKPHSYDIDDVLAPRKATMSLIVRRRTGFTERLYRKAEKSISGSFTTTAYVEGPYGNQDFDSYGTVMLFAAGVGITHQVPHVRSLVAGFANGTCATRRVVLVWIIQSPEHLEWIRPWMTQILSMEKRRDVLKVLLFITRPRSVKEIHSPSSSVQMYPGKPDVGALITQEQHKQVGAMAVSVCGTGSLSDDVRKAVRDRCETSEIDFVENAFSW
ncbi:hypothetical protein MBLNU457_5100t2 [Dothideomycetes sp. NU457]